MTFKADVYKLCCLDPEVKDIYVGSTRSFRQRKNCHKTRCNNPTDKDHNYYVYQFIREHGGWVNWNMISLFTGDFETKHEMHRKEREYMETLGATLNKQIPSRTKQERKNEKFRCECGVVYTYTNKSTHFRSKKHIEGENERSE